jgi:3,4-dihydroxy 2-butanone 4-phosphate synthase/GTP cyclohydrolase II
LALIFGAPGGEAETLVRIQREEVIDDVFASRHDQGGSRIPQTLQRLRAGAGGVLIYLREGTAGVPTGSDDEAAPDAPAGGTEQARGRLWHDVGIGAQILRDLGITRITLLATRHRRYVGLAGFGIDIVAHRAARRLSRAAFLSA